MIQSIRQVSRSPFSRTTVSVMPQFWAGFTLGGLISRPAPCSEDIPCCTVCHISCTIQVGIRSVSAVLAMFRVPVTNRSDSKSAPRASAAVERRECRGECASRDVLSEGFVFTMSQVILKVKRTRLIPALTNGVSAVKER